MPTGCWVQSGRLAADGSQGRNRPEQAGPPDSRSDDRRRATDLTRWHLAKAWVSLFVLHISRGGAPPREMCSSRCYSTDHECPHLGSCVTSPRAAQVHAGGSGCTGELPTVDASCAPRRPRAVEPVPTQYASRLDRGGTVRKVSEFGSLPSLPGLAWRTCRSVKAKRSISRGYSHLPSTGVSTVEEEDQDARNRCP